MPDVEVLANAETRKVLTARPGRGLPQDAYDQLAKKLSDVANRVEPKGAGFYGIDLTGGHRAIFTYTDDMRPVMVYAGDHKGYDALSDAIRNDAGKARSNFLKETPEKVTISSKKALKPVTLDEFRDAFLKTTGKEAVLAEEAAKAAAQGGKFMKGAKAGVKAGGKIFKVAAVGIVADEILGLTSKAEAAQLDGRLPQQAVEEYRKILAGQAATVADPTFVLGEMGVQGAFASWAKKYVTDPKLEAELRPTSLLETLGLPMPTVAESKRSDFYRSLPDKDNPSLPLDIRELVKAKEDIHKAAQALVKEKSGFWNAMAQSGGARDEDLYPAQTKAMDDAQQRFNDLYAKKLESGAVEAWNNRAQPRPGQNAPARQ